MHREGRDLALVKPMLPRLDKLIQAARQAKTKLIWIYAPTTPGRTTISPRCGWNNASALATAPMLNIRYASRVSGTRIFLGASAAREVMSRHRYGAFENTDLDLVLRSNRIKSVIITGVATNVCCETTARQAFMKDYYVLFTSDCCATYSQAQHDATLFNISQFFGQVVTSEEIMAYWPAAETKLRAVS